MFKKQLFYYMTISKAIVRKCPTCSLHNQTLLPSRSNLKGTQGNQIWQMDVFHIVEFGKIKYIHRTIDTYSEFQWASALSLEDTDSVFMHLLAFMANMSMPAHIKQTKVHHMSLRK